MTTTPTLADLVRRYRRDQLSRELRSDWAVAVLYRLPSLVLVRLLLPTAVTPMAVTLAGLLLVLAMPVAALALPPGAAGIALGLLAVAFQIVDCADGGLARARNACSRLGGLVDGLVDMAQWGVLYTCAGLVADRVLAAGGDTGLAWTFAGCAAAWLRLFARAVRDAAPPTAPATDLRAVAAPDAGAVLLSALAGLSGLIAPGIVVAALAGGLPVLVVLLLVYALADVVDALLQTLRADPDAGGAG